MVGFAGPFEVLCQSRLRGISAPFHCISFCSELTYAIFLQCDIKGSIDISMVNMSTMWAFKVFTVALACKSATAAILAR
jgi:hypothetical protein